MIIHYNDISQFEKRYRTAFINSLAGFRQAVLVGTKSADGFANLAIFNSLIHLGANPALFGLMSRPDTVQRDTLQNILDTKEYTLNFIQAAHYKKAHQTSARYDRGISEFEQVGFPEAYHPAFHAPFVEDAVVKIAMKFEESIPIQLNGTVLVIGSVQQVEIDAAMVGPDGFVDLSAADVLISQGLDAYFVSKEIGRLAYAKP
ncbi:flavin reductase family protein [Flavihumibacter fluvii]|uniref:flavin reductase family protein n=1 Tax=Flavihumibacter fluvii TaxID=2838157 RepID=UPI001BDDCC36|nr:flavin reductase [Flavihumibacter fluvii]ULQ50954.1 flavin reductase [Flavihumibacter fluvii]